jgi:hypothetical protein
MSMLTPKESLHVLLELLQLQREGDYTEIDLYVFRLNVQVQL